MNDGERQLQDRLGTRERADAFHSRQTLRHLNDTMRDFIGRQEMMFLATADAAGDCDSTFRAGPPGFVRVLDEQHLSWPEYRGNGVMASLGNITENAHVGLLFIDFREAIGLHVNGRASILENDQLLARPDLPDSVLDGLLQDGGRRPERWVAVDVVEAYIHCSKHIPQMVKRSEVRQAWGTDDVVRKGGDYFKAKHSTRPWVDDVAAGAAVPGGAS